MELFETSKGSAFGYICTENASYYYEDLFGEMGHTYNLLCH